MRRPVSLWRLAVLSGAALATLWIAWNVVARTAAQNMATSDPDAALRWYAGEAAALDKLAGDELSDAGGDPDTARNWAERALRTNPLDSRALFLLGLAAEKKGDPQRAAALIGMSGARSWRDEATQAWLFNRAVRAGDYASALPHVDAILRVNEANERFFPVLAAFTVRPDSFRALVDFLATTPPWRYWYLARLSAQLANKTRLDQLYAALKESPAPPTTRELRPYLERLIKDGNYRRAHQVWRETLPAALGKTDDLLFNADFERPVNDLPFNWELTPITGADMQVVPIASRKTRALRLQFSGARVNFANVKHLLLLPPGSYYFSGRQKADQLDASRGLWWRIFCADNPKTVLGRTDLLARSVPWSDFNLAFQVPASGCQAQWLRIELPARIASEHRIEGDVWYEHLRVGTEPPGGQTSEIR